MSPVSRGRRPKKNRKPQRRSGGNPGAAPLPATPAAPASAPRPERPPEWFGGAIGRVLTTADGLSATRSPQELDQAVAELLGGELHTALRTERVGLFFQWWLDELGTAVVQRIEQDDADDDTAAQGTGTRAGAIWLLHGIAAQCGTLPDELVQRARNAVAARPGERLPPWVSTTPRPAATGAVLRLRDAYGTRFGVVIEYSYPDVPETSWYLLDIDTSAFVVLVDAGVHDTPEQAAAAWRENADSPDATADEVDDPAMLTCLVKLDTGSEAMGVKGDESRRVMDNWFRARTRIDVLDRTLRREKRPLPPVTSLYRDIDPTVLAEPFTAWHIRTHGSEPDPETVATLAEEWMEGSLPETWFCASPERIRFHRALISDWVPDHPVTLGVLALLPEWTCWLGERAGLPAHRMEALLAAVGSTRLRPPTTA